MFKPCDDGLGLVTQHGLPHCPMPSAWPSVERNDPTEGPGVIEECSNECAASTVVVNLGLQYALVVVITL